MSVTTLDRSNKPTCAPYRLLDSWRGVAALWVVMIHASPNLAQAPALAKDPLYAFSLWGGLGVTMFFVISGYCIMAAAVNSLRQRNAVLCFSQARLRRIYPPYLASMIMAILITSCFAFLVAHGVVPKAHHQAPFQGESFLFYFAALTLTQVPFHVQPIIPVYWSLCYEVTFYIIVASLLGVFGRKSSNAFYSGISIVTLLSLIWLIMSPSTCPFPINLWYQFGLGAMVYMLIAQPQARFIKIGFVGSIILAAYYSVIYEGSHSLGHPSSRAQTLFSLAFVFVLLILYQFDGVLTRQRWVKVLEWLGTFSYSLYLSHYLILAVPQQLAKRLGFIDRTYWVSFLAQIAVSIVFAYLFHIIFERPFLSSRAKERKAQIRFSKAAESVRPLDNEIDIVSHQNSLVS